MYGFLGYSGNFFLTLLPTYLKNHRHIDSQTAGLLTSLPFACGVTACLAGGALSDLFIRRWGPRWGRRSIGAVGLALGAVGIIATTWATERLDARAASSASPSSATTWRWARPGPPRPTSAASTPASSPAP